MWGITFWTTLVAHFQNKNSRKENVSYQTLVWGNSTLRYGEGKAVPVYHSNAKWNGKTETCIKIEDSLLGVTFHMRQWSRLFTKQCQLHHKQTLRVNEHFSNMTHSYIHKYLITIVAFSSTVLWDAYHFAI